MATRIRLRRGGRKGKPYYRIVVQDARTRSRGAELDTLGVYHPAARPEPVSEVNAVRALYWLRNGAEMSDTARGLMSKLGVLKHLHDGTNPEEQTAAVKGGAVEDKGYNAPPTPNEEPVVTETAAEEALETATEPEVVADAESETVGNE